MTGRIAIVRAPLPSAAAHRELDAPIGLVHQQRVEIHRAVDAYAVDRLDEVARLDVGERGGAQVQHLGHPQLAPLLVLAAIEAHAEPADIGLRRGAGPVHAGVRRIQLADHETHDAAQIFGALRAGGIRLVAPLDRVPIDAVHVRLEEVVGENAPRLVEDGELLAREVDVEVRGDGDGPHCARVDVDRVDAAVLEVVDLFAVRTELRALLEARRRRELTRHRGAVRQLVEREGVQVRLPRGRGVEQRRLAVRADDDVRTSTPTGKKLIRRRMSSKTICVDFFPAPRAESARTVALSRCGGAGCGAGWTGVPGRDGAKRSRNWSSRNCGVLGMRSTRAKTACSVRCDESNSRYVPSGLHAIVLPNAFERNAMGFPPPPFTEAMLGF